MDSQVSKCASFLLLIPIKQFSTENRTIKDTTLFSIWSTYIKLTPLPTTHLPLLRPIACPSWCLACAVLSPHPYIYPYLHLLLHPCLFYYLFLMALSLLYSRRLSIIPGDGSIFPCPLSRGWLLLSIIRWSCRLRRLLFPFQGCWLAAVGGTSPFTLILLRLRGVVIGVVTLGWGVACYVICSYWVFLAAPALIILAFAGAPALPLVWVRCLWGCW